MEVIIIQKKTFDEFFKQTLEKLELEVLKGEIDGLRGYRINTPIGEMHRKFVYEVMRLKDRIATEK